MKGMKERKIMKKRKILYLFPLAALVLSGCTLQEGWDLVKDFSVSKVYEPVRDWILGLMGKEVPKKDDKKDDQGGGGRQDGGGEEEVSKYGTAAKPLSVSEAITLISNEDPTNEVIYVTGTIISNGAWNTQYEQVDITIGEGEQNLKVFRATVLPDGITASEITANSLKGMTLVASGIGMTYGETYEVAADAENGILCTVLSLSGEAEQQGQVDNYGTAEHPLTVSEAIEVIKIQDPTKQPIYVTGEVNGNGDWYSAKSNIDIYLTDGVNTIQMFRADKFPEGMDLSSVKKNDLVGKIVVGKGTGTYYVDGKKYELDSGCEVISMVDPVIEIEGVELSAQHLDLEVGQQASLTAKVLPEDKANQEVTWTVTSNETADVVTCNDGVIVANAVGTATITATSVADPTKTAECSVTVTEATKTLQSIAIVGDIATQYNEDDAYSAEGLKVMAHYDKGDDVDVTADAQIILSKEVAEPGDTLLTITAIYAGQEAIKEVAVTVTAVNQFVEAYEAALALESSSDETDEFTFKGVIAAKRQDNEWFIQHEGYGIEYYGNNENFAVGKQVKVKSTLQKFNGLPETKTISSAVVLGDGTMPDPVEITTVAEQNAAKLNVLANVTGVAKEDWSAYSAGSNKTLKLTVADGEIDVYFKKNLFNSQEAELKAVKAGDTVSFGKVVTSIYNNPQILFVAGSTITVTSAPAKTISEIVSVVGPEEVAVNGSVSANQVTVTVKYSDGSTGEATVTSVVVDTTSAGQKEADVTIEGWDATLHFTITVFQPAGDSTTVTFKAEDLIEDPSAAYTGGSVKLTSYNIDNVLTVSVTGGSNSGKIYKSNDYGFQIRLYNSSNDHGVLTVTAADGYEITAATAMTADGASTWWGEPAETNMTIASGGGSASIEGKITVYSVTVTYSAK